MTNRYVCACGKTAICGAYATRDIRDQQPVLVFCADCTPYLKDLPLRAQFLGALPLAERSGARPWGGVRG